VEAVANISNTAEPLAALWTLALYFVLARDADTEAFWRRSLLAGVLFTLAMLSKESGVMSLAVALLAVEAWRPRSAVPSREPGDTPARSSWSTLWHRWRRVAIAGMASMVGVFAMRSMVLAGATSGSSLAAVGIEKMSMLERVWAMLSLGPSILGLLVWPRLHNPYYGPSTFPMGVHAIIAAVLTLVTLTLVVLVALRLARRPGGNSSPDARLLAGIGWALLAFLPASNLLVATGQILAERTLYLSSIGIAMVLAWGMDRIAVGIEQTRTAPPRSRRAAIWVVPVVVMMLSLRFAALARDGTRAWRSHRALIDQMIEADPDGYRGHYLLAIELRRGGATDSIAHELETAYRLYPRDPQLDLDYARFLLAHEQPARAVQVSNMLMSDARMHNDADAIGVYLEARGRAYGPDSVLAEASRLYQIRPHPTLALYMGLAYEARTNRRAALSAYRAGLQLAPRDSALTARLAALQ
jgi:tetratricopeptide (TPR) repeat protein